MKIRKFVAEHKGAIVFWSIFATLFIIHFILTMIKVTNCNIRGDTSYLNYAWCKSSNTSVQKFFLLTNTIGIDSVEVYVVTLLLWYIIIKRFLKM